MLPYVVHRDGVREAKHDAETTAVAQEEGPERSHERGEDEEWQAEDYGAEKKQPIVNVLLQEASEGHDYGLDDSDTW